MPCYKVLHVGVTNRGRWPLEYATPASGFVSHALCDISPAALAEARQTTGLPESACFTDAGEVIARSGADCVIICAPTIFHVPMATLALEAGMPVLMEKGMAPDWNTARAFVTLVESRRAVAAVAQNYRYKTIERTLGRALNDPSFEAYLGAVHQISYSQQRVRPKPGTLTYPFASIWDMSCHHLDTLLNWLGPIREVTAQAWRPAASPYQHAANTSAHLVFANETRVHYLHSHDASRHTLDIELHGERGALFFHDDRLTFSERPTEQFGVRPLREIIPRPKDDLADLLADFNAYISRGIEPGISARRNLETMAACELMVRSITGRRCVGRDELDGSV